jgi:hypothetical protein
MTEAQAERFWKYLLKNSNLNLGSYRARLIFDYVNKMTRDMAPKEAV